MARTTNRKLSRGAVGSCFSENALDRDIDNMPRKAAQPLPPSREARFLASIVEFGQISERSARQAQSVIDHYGSFATVLDTPEVELREETFIGRDGALNIAAARSIMLQSAFAPLRNVPVIDNLAALTRYLLLRMGRDRVESLRLLSLDVKGHLLFDQKIADGTVTQVYTTPMEILHHAIKNRAKSIILVHNHPSGDPLPSQDDVALTDKIFYACHIMEITLIDHIIVAGSSWTSLKQRGAICLSTESAYDQRSGFFLP